MSLEYATAYPSLCHDFWLDVRIDSHLPIRLLPTTRPNLLHRLISFFLFSSASLLVQSQYLVRCHLIMLLLLIRLPPVWLEYIFHRVLIPKLICVAYLLVSKYRSRFLRSGIEFRLPYVSHSRQRCTPTWSRPPPLSVLASARIWAVPCLVPIPTHI